MRLAIGGDSADPDDSAPLRSDSVPPVRACGKVGNRGKAVGRCRQERAVDGQPSCLGRGEQVAGLAVAVAVRLAGKLDQSSAPSRGMLGLEGLPSLCQVQDRGSTIREYGAVDRFTVASVPSKFNSGWCATCSRGPWWARPASSPCRSLQPPSLSRRRRRQPVPGPVACGSARAAR